MKFNTKTRYGLRTVLELAVRDHESGVLQKEISESQDISFKYLDHLVSGLKSAGLIRNADGRNSGYVLNRDPESISVYDVYKAFEAGLETETNIKPGCAAREFWYGLNRKIAEYMQNTTLTNLAERQKELDSNKTDSMYYI